jgi:hypothetical protein
METAMSKSKKTATFAPKTRKANPPESVAQAKRSRKTIKAKTARAGEQTLRANTKLATVVAMLRSPRGTTIEDLSKATAWQAHSVRGVIAGAIKKKLKLTVTSEKIDGVRTYRISA